MAGAKQFQFKTRLSSMKVNFISTVIFIPEAILRQLPGGRIRTEGTINGAPFKLAIQFRKDGRRFLVVSQALRKAAKVKVGDPVLVSFQLPDPDRLELPEELEVVLAQDEEARTVWESFTRGAQRGLAHYVSSVKNVDSRIKRALELMQKAKLGLLHVQKTKPGKNKEP